MKRKSNKKAQKHCQTCGGQLVRRDFNAAHKYGGKRICLWCAGMWIHDCCNGR